MKMLLLGLLLFLVCSGAKAAPNPLFDVKFEDASGGTHLLTLAFYRKVPPPAVVDKMLRELLNDAIAFDPTKDIVAAAFKDDDNLSENQYSGMLIYTAKTHKVQTDDEYRAVKKSTTTGAGYMAEVKEQKTAEGIKAERKWLDVSIVFPKQPNRDTAYQAIKTEISRLAARHLDVNAYVMIGDPKIPTSWTQVRDADSAYIFAEYSVQTGQTTRKGKPVSK